MSKAVLAPLNLSSIPVGTAPLIMASTTLVGNLNADLLDGQHGAYYLAWANFTGKPTTLAGYGITDAVMLNDTIMNNNAFGGRKLYIANIDNALAAADKRYIVTVTTHLQTYLSESYPKLNPDWVSSYSVSGSGTVFTVAGAPTAIVVYNGTTICAPNASPTTQYQYTYSGGTLTFGATVSGAITVYPDHTVPQYLDSPVEATLSSVAPFDGTYESMVTAPIGQYLKVRVMSTADGNTNFPGYPYGSFFMSYYYTSTGSGASQYRCYNRNLHAHGIGWKVQSFTDFVGNPTLTAYIQTVSDELNHGRTILEFIAHSSATRPVSVTELEWKLTRPAMGQLPVVTTYGQNKLYYNLTFGTQTTTNVTINPAGLIDIHAQANEARFRLANTALPLGVDYVLSSGGATYGIYDRNGTPAWALQFTASTRAASFAGTVSAPGFSGPLTGNATTATTLQTARTIGISGPVTGTATSFNGSANITIPVTALDVGNAAVTGILPATKGGTGLGAYTAGNYIRAATGTTLEQRTPTQVRADIGAGTGNGTVTSVAVANATGITWTGSPITGAGTLTPTLSANLQAWSGITPASKADDSNVVHIAGTETITGAKTFTSAITRNTADGTWSYIIANASSATNGGLWRDDDSSIRFANAAFNAEVILRNASMAINAASTTLNGTTVSIPAAQLVLNPTQGVAGFAENYGLTNADALRGALRGGWNNAPGTGTAGTFYTHMNFPGAGGRDMQLAWYTGADNVQGFRYRIYNDQGSWNPWHTFWSDVNLNPVTINTNQTITGGKTFQVAPAFYAGTFGTQAFNHHVGWNNNVMRWAWVLEANASFSLYSYDSSAGGGTQFFNFSTTHTSPANSTNPTRLTLYGDIALTRPWESGGLAAAILLGSGGGAYLYHFDAGSGLYVTASSHEFVTPICRPNSDNTHALGRPSHRWSVVYAATGTINTSDAREKTEVQPFTEQEMKAAKQLAKAIGTYKWLRDVQDRGERAHTHIGLTAQRVISIMAENGLDAFAYGFVSFDTWEESVSKTPDGEEIIHPKGDVYGVRYDELAMFIAAGMEARLAALEALNV